MSNTSQGPGFDPFSPTEDSDGYDNFNWRRYIASSEQIIWRGTPSRQFDLLSGGRISAYLFALIFAGITVFAGFSALSGNANTYIKVTAIFIAGIGVYTILGHPIVDWLRRRRIFYCVTDRRVYIAKTGSSDNLISYPLTPDTPLALDGSDLLIGPRPALARARWQWSEEDWAGASDHDLVERIDGVTLRMIDSPIELYGLIRDYFEGSGASVRDNVIPVTPKQDDNHRGMP